MSAALEYRIVAGYVLAVALGVLIYFHHTIPPLKIDMSRRHSRARRAVAGGWSCLLMLFVFAPDLIRMWGFDTFVMLRWLTLLPVTGAILLLVWTARSHLGLDGEGGFVADGTYSWSRYPLDAAMIVLIFALGLFVSNFLLLACSLLAVVLLVTAVPKEQEQVRLAMLGDRYRAYAAATGRFLPVMAARQQTHYVVPKRFGLTAILALLTTLAVVFGALRYANAPPVVYLFIGSEIVAICLVQIFFGSAPRGGSALTGAILLPFWVIVFLDTASIPAAWQVAFIVTLIAAGALLGYCIGTLAAGFFLVTDLVEMTLARSRHPFSLHDQHVPSDGNALTSDTSHA